MELYQGVKIKCRCTAEAFDGFEEALQRLHYWTHLFSQLGLAPLHPEGAYGNQSFRTGPDTFIITRSGMQPRESFQKDDYCHVISCEVNENSCCYIGRSLPSSEALLHYLLYRAHPWIGAILHGHSALLLDYSEQLNIPTTTTAHPYGTTALAQSAAEVVGDSTRIFNLKNHGFVALGNSLDDAGNTTLSTYSRLLALLSTNR